METTANFQMTDLHIHLVFGVDDGARDLDMALEMLRSAYEQGARKFFCSSHSSSNLLNYKNNFTVLKVAVSELFPDVELYTSCEIYASDMETEAIIEGIKTGKLLTLGGTRYVLTEYSLQESAERILKDSESLIREGYIPVIAHAERYLATEDSGFVSRLTAKGAKIQVNAYSLDGEQSTAIKARARRMLAAREVSFLGSDAHTTHHRPPSIAAGLAYIYSAVDRDYADRIVTAREIIDKIK